MEKKVFTVAIDGPAASGKGTLAPALAKEINGFYLPTGAMYRCLALSCLRQDVSSTDVSAVITVLRGLTISFAGSSIILNGEDVTAKLKDEKVSLESSNVSLIPKVREEMVKRQQEVANEYLTEGKTVIAEGRDTGTRLFPDADVKIFLTANQEIRAKRRQQQLQELGRKVSFDQVLADLKKRDYQDQHRQADPLVTEPEKHGYIIVDDSDQTEDGTIQEILTLLKKKGLIQ